jgi:hypothetical protein
MFNSIHRSSRITWRQLAVLVFLAANSRLFAAEWMQVHPGKLYNLSGLAVLAQHDDRTEFVVVHDNKKPDEPRLGLVTAAGGQVKYRALTWPSSENFPADLESISTVPDRPGQLLALCSDGRLFLLSVAGETVSIVSTATIPDLPPDVNIEGFSIQKMGDQLLAVWGHRGAGPEHGVLFWAVLDRELKRVTSVSKIEIEVPFPSASDATTRHISDLKLDPSGVLWGAATSDPGDDGPFLSAIYVLGVFQAGPSAEFQFDRNEHLTRLWTFPRKIEAMDFVPGSRGAIALATDDENDGGWLYYQQAAPAAPATAATGP